MNAQRHEQVKSIFLRACDLPTRQQDEFLQNACGDDAELREEVDSLLRHHKPETLLSGLSDTDIHGQPRRPVDSGMSWVGRMLGSHRVTGVLDSGGMGTVLEGFDTAIHRRVAIKVLHPHLAEDESIRMRFLAEARSAGGLNHPNVITIYEVAESADLPYLVMEFAEGGSAADRLVSQGAFTTQDATRMASEACRGLAAAHSIGLVHRDVKPANLLLTADGTVKVTDFGIAKTTHNAAMNLTQTGQIVGTPYFMSPEQCEGKEIDARSDIYSLGATYYSLLVGENPFRDQESLVSIINAHCHKPPPDPRSIDPSVPEWCAAVIQRSMAKRPSDRFSEIAEMEATLRQREAKMVSTKSPRHRMMAGAVALLLFSLVAAWFFRGGGDRPLIVAPEGSQSRPEVGGASPPKPILVGLLHSLTGTMAQSERGMLDAYELAIDEINSEGGLLGRPVRSLSRDGRSNDTVFAEQAETLITDENICTLFGCVTSSSRKAVKEVVELHNHLLVYSVNHEGLETSPNIVYLGGGPSHTVIPASRWAYGFLNKRSFFLVGSDYVYPRVVNEMLKDEFSKMGAEVVGEHYLPLGTPDVNEAVEAISKAQPEMIINTISGDTQFVFFRALRASGVTAPQLVTGVGEEERWGMGGDDLHEDYTIATYFQSLRTNTNRDFVDRFRSKFGKSRVINASMETAYTAIRLWARAVEATGGTEPSAIHQAMRGQEFEAPSGPIMIDPTTSYAQRSYLIGKFQGGRDFGIVLQGPPLIMPSPYPSSRTHEEWEQLLDRLRLGWNGGWSAP